jgi:hypothetical protein
MLGPFADFVASYVASWNHADGRDAEARIESFVRGLLVLAEENRVVLISAIAHFEDSTDDSEVSLLEDLAGIFGQISDLVIRTDEWDFEPAPVVAATAGSVLSTVLLQGLLFPPGREPPPREELVAALSQFILFGIGPLFDPPLQPRRRRR